MKIGVGLSIEQDPALAAKEACRMATSNLYNSKISLAIIFNTPSLTSSYFLKTISVALADASVIGCSAAAIISNKGIFKHGLAIIAFSFPENIYFNIASMQNIRSTEAINAGEELGEKLLYGFKGLHRDLGMIFSDSLNEAGSKFIYGLQARLGKSFPLVGASPSPDMRFGRTHLYLNQDILHDSVLGILWGGKIRFGLGIKHGWRPLGRPRVVTKIEDNIIYEIDGDPAVRIYEDYLAKDITELQKEIKRISILYPLGVYLPGEKEYLLRNITAIENDGSLRLQSNISPESSVRLMIGTKESCLEATEEAVYEAKKNFNSSLPESEEKDKKNFVLVFDSLSRYMLLRRDAKRELDIIKNSFGEDTPIIGIYTTAEQAPLKAITYQGQSYMHNQSIAVLTISG
ncbi:MAG: FIST N-terminal domain-containing protein [Candidatus Omnitrophota bacterium]